MSKPEVVFVEPGDMDKEIADNPPIEHKLPPYPVPFRPFTDDDPKFPGDMKDMRERVNFKLYTLWVLWASLRVNKHLEELISRADDPESDAYIAKNCIVDIIDKIAKLLSCTNLHDEISWLVLSDEDFKKRNDLIKQQEAEAKKD